MRRLAQLSHHVAGVDDFGRPLPSLPLSSRAVAPEAGLFWQDIEAHGLTRPKFGALSDSADRSEADCVIIGAGIVGLKLARYLSQHGLTVIVLEGAAIGDQAASARNQGCLQRVVDSEYATMGADANRMELLGKENRRLVREQVAEYDITCDWLDTPECSLVCKDTPGAEVRFTRRLYFRSLFRARFGAQFRSNVAQGILSAMRVEVAARQQDGQSCRFLDADGAAEMGPGGKEHGLVSLLANELLWLKVFQLFSLLI